jgi:DNA-binding NarL/FixJ family response regulator
MLLMDIEMPEMDGIEITKQIKGLSSEIKIMMLCVLDQENKIFEAIKARASGYLIKNE